MRREESRHDFAFIAGVIVGAVSGALVTLALTPLSGAQTREKVMERVGDLEPMKERATGLATSGKHLVETGRGIAVDLVAKSPLPFGEHVAAEADVAAHGTMTTHDGMTLAEDTTERNELAAATTTRAATTRPTDDQG